MSEGLYRVVDVISAIGAAARSTAADLAAAASAATSTAAANATGAKGGSGVTVHAVGPGLAADVVNALKQLGGRT
jgi:hypothetical protein